MAGDRLKLGRPAAYEDIEALPDNLGGEVLGGELCRGPHERRRGRGEGPLLAPSEPDES